MKSIVILISGRGSNMEAIIRASESGDLPVRIAGVLSNRPEAPGLATALSRKIPTRAIDHRQFSGREAFDAAMIEAIDAFAPDFVVLAGFMRILSDRFVEHYASRLINIHPSLLPSFPGLHTHRRALESGVRIHGCSVHFVTPVLDHGPIVVQAAVPVLDGDDEHSLAARVTVQEHRIYPLALGWLAAGRLRMVDGRVLLEANQGDGGALISPTII